MKLHESLEMSPLRWAACRVPCGKTPVEVIVVGQEGWQPLLAMTLPDALEESPLRYATCTFPFAGGLMRATVEQREDGWYSTMHQVGEENGSYWEDGKLYLEWIEENLACYGDYRYGDRRWEPLTGERHAAIKAWHDLHRWGFPGKR